MDSNFALAPLEMSFTSCFASPLVKGKEQKTFKLPPLLEEESVSKILTYFPCSSPKFYTQTR